MGYEQGKEGFDLKKEEAEQALKEPKELKIEDKLFTVKYNPSKDSHIKINHEVCKKCKRYLKEVRSNIEVANFPFDKFYLGTLPLDIIAAKEEYIQESVLTVRYNNSDGNELLMYRQKVEFK